MVNLILVQDIRLGGKEFYFLGPSDHGGGRLISGKIVVFQQVVVIKTSNGRLPSRNKDVPGTRYVQLILHTQSVLLLGVNTPFSRTVNSVPHFERGSSRDRRCHSKRPWSAVGWWRKYQHNLHRRAPFHHHRRPAPSTVDASVKLSPSWHHHFHHHHHHLKKIGQNTVRNHLDCCDYIVCCIMLLDINVQVFVVIRLSM